MAKVATKAKKQEFDKKTYLWWYEIMLLMRKFEEKCGQLYIQQKFGGFCHLYIGQEAVLAGIVSAIKKTDNLITAYRDHAHPIALGAHPKITMAELYGRSTGSSKGQGGSMHMFNKELNLFGGHGIVGGQIPLGAGIAFADKYKGNKNVTFCFMGDGAVRQGVLHETFNMAMTWMLPVVFVIENNNYAMGTSVERTSNVTELYQLGSAYNMPSFPVDGMSPEAVHKATAEAATRARKGNGPTLLEVKTYRYKGHSMSDPQKYRTKAEVESYKKEDPIQKVLETIKLGKLASEKQLEEIKKRVLTLVEESVEYAQESPLPDASALYDDVYVQKDYPFIKD